MALTERVILVQTIFIRKKEYLWGNGGCRGFQKVTEEGQRGKQKVYSFTQIRHVYVMINVQTMKGTLTHCVNQEGAHDNEENNHLFCFL